MAKKYLIFLCAALLAVSPFAVNPAHGSAAAGFVFTPVSGAYMGGSNIAVTVSVDTKGNVINAADGTISFPTDLLRVVSISKASSIFKFWVQDPVYSNTDGTISFSGGLPTPGFIGSSGTAFSITFKALGSGVAKLKFTSGDILANDGLGTNILAFNEEPAYQISSYVESAKGKPLPAEESAEASGVPAKPSFFSHTHPSGSAWYSSKLFEISWNLPSDVDGVNYAFVKDANYRLSQTSKGLADHASYDISSYDDGVWYFYARLHNSNGWGPAASYAAQIDILPPYPFAVTRVDGEDETNPSPIIAFSASDAASPISHYDISIDKGSPMDALTLKRGNAYALPVQLPGDHSISVRAYDSASNFTDESLQVNVKALVSPEIISYSPTASPPQRPFVVSGLVPPHASPFAERVVISLRGDKDGAVFEAPIKNDGTWSATFSNRLVAGHYSLVAYLADERGARSNETEPKTVNVGGWLADVLALIGEYSVAGIGVVVGLSVVIGLALFFYTRLFMLRKRFFADIKRFERKLDSSLSHIEKDLHDENKKGVDIDLSANHEKHKHLVKDIEILEGSIKSEIDELKKISGK